MDTLPGDDPADVGVKLTVIADVLSPGLTLIGKVGDEIVNGPLVEIPLTESTAVPVFLILKGSWAVSPTFTSPKARLVSDGIACANGVV
jgi:hypothetical protein